MIAKDALERLIEGNQRFVEGMVGEGIHESVVRRDKFTAYQSPFAIILGCADSRVPAELVFDQGLGDLFVIRVAGNIVAPSQIGSIEFAVGNFGTPLVVVLGHTDCGAVKATLSELQRPSAERSKNLESIVQRIQPAVEGVLHKCSGHHDEEIVEQAIRANVQTSVQQLKDGSDILRNFIEEGKLTVVGAEYSLKTGEVEFFEGMEVFEADEMCAFA